MYQILHIIRYYIYVKLIPGSESLVRNRGNVAFLENIKGITKLQFDIMSLRLKC